MKLKFKHQPFQDDAVNAVADLFVGQDKQVATFSIAQGEQLSLEQNHLGIGNALRIDAQVLADNMHAVQKRNNLPLTNDAASMQFCVEMETGTGKTYVYTKTIFELHKRYGFAKFIIVVPSVAIREGVKKSLEVTEEHFAIQYDNVPYRYFMYNSARLNDVRDFATHSTIEIMIINIDAFKKTENVINQAQEKLNGKTAMRYIRDTRPIVIIDEPQSVDNTPKAKEAIASLNPLCVLRYSATHREKLNLLYRLTPVDAYRMGLVKQICVSSNHMEFSYNKPYIKLLSVSRDGGFKARVEIDVAAKNGKVTRKTVTVKDGSDLYILSGKRDLYEGYTVTGIDCTLDYESIEFGNAEFLKLGHAFGDIDQTVMRRMQIQRTIEAHLDKELQYTEKGIKVLSLFFIDEVKKYRTDEGGPGEYAAMFEECYGELLNRPKYAPLKKRFTAPVDKVHDGYFSQDTKGKYKNTRGDTQDDYSTYDTIMKDKEWLLNFECPLRFIFSHSALKEGWDNPNVFQVCTLIEQRSVFTARQKIGRGLRLCVNQSGERVEDRSINSLHVMANESFAEFAANLQKEIEQETGVRFELLDIGIFQGMAYTETVQEARVLSADEAEQIVEHFKKQGLLSDSGEPTPALQAAIKEQSLKLPPETSQAGAAVAKVITHVAATRKPLTAAALTGVAYISTVETEKTLTYDDAKEILGHFAKKGYITEAGTIHPTLKKALKTGTLDLPARFAAARGTIEQSISGARQRVPIRDASRDVIVKLNEKALRSPEFMELWEKLKQKTTYRVTVDTGKLIRRCVQDLQDMERIPKARIVSKSADIHIESSGVRHNERGIRTHEVEEDYAAIPDVLAVIGEKTLTKRSTVRDILVQSDRLQDLLNNPQLFIEKCVDVIKNRRHELAVEGVTYEKLAGEEYTVEEVFDSPELVANLDMNAVAVKNSVYDHIIYESDTVERPFALALDNDPDVRMFFKIPKKFIIETPIGTYNPDWAVYLDCDGTRKLFLVLETKGDENEHSLRGKENMKIRCGTKHFLALGNGISLHVVRDWENFRTKLS